MKCILRTAGGAGRFQVRYEFVDSTPVPYHWQYDTEKAADPTFSILLRQAPGRLEPGTPAAVAVGGGGDCSAQQHPYSRISCNEGHSGCAQPWHAGARRPIRFQVSAHKSSHLLTFHVKISQIVTPHSPTIPLSTYLE